MPTAESELNFSTPFELLVAVVLSAQCTDKRVNMTTPALFAAYPTAEAMSKASAEEIYAPPAPKTRHPPPPQLGAEPANRQSREHTVQAA